MLRSWLLNYAGGLAARHHSVILEQSRVELPKNIRETRLVHRGSLKTRLGTPVLSVGKFTCLILLRLRCGKISAHLLDMRIKFIKKFISAFG